MPSWQRKLRIDGRVAGNAIEPMSYAIRHDALVVEMVQRGMRHRSPLTQPDFSYLPLQYQQYRIDVARNLLLLLERCPACFKRYCSYQQVKHDD
jgi:hypothetical protein